MTSSAGPSAYEATAAKFNYHFRREPAPFEMDPQAPFNLFYLKYREGSPFNVDDWEGFRDPAKLTYADYVTLQHERETYVDLLTDHHEAAESAATLDAGLGRRRCESCSCRCASRCTCCR